jgi:hypothetical protein
MSGPVFKTLAKGSLERVKIAKGSLERVKIGLSLSYSQGRNWVWAG